MAICLGHHIACARTTAESGKNCEILGIIIAAVWWMITNNRMENHWKRIQKFTHYLYAFACVRWITLCAYGNVWHIQAQLNFIFDRQMKWKKNEEMKLLKIVCEWVHAVYYSSMEFYGKSVGEPEHRRQRRWWSSNRYARNLWFWFCMCAVHHHRCK